VHWKQGLGVHEVAERHVQIASGLGRFDTVVDGLITDGVLTPVPGSAFGEDAAVGPVSVALDPAARFAYY
jgi:hypothetical protein